VATAETGSPSPSYLPNTALARNQPAADEFIENFYCGFALAFSFL